MAVAAATPAGGAPDAHVEPAPSRRRVLLVGAGIVLLATATLFGGLGRYPLWDPDEARHAEIASEMLASGSWVEPQLFGKPYHDKPILYYWLTATAFRLGGKGTLSARAVSATSALLLVLTVFVWAQAAWDLRAAAAAALTLLTSIEFLALGRFGDLNMLLTLHVTCGILAVERWERRHGHGPGLVIAAGAAALGALTKGLVAPALIAAVGLCHLWRRRELRLLWSPHVPLAAAVFLAVAVPWYAIVGLRSPDYVRDFFLTHHLHRMLGGRRLHPEPFWFTSVAAALCFLPWTPLLPAAVRRALHDEPDDASLFCLRWAGIVVALFTIPRGKLPTYVLPAMAPCALFIGRYWSVLARRAPDLREGGLLRFGLGLLAALAFLGPALAIALTTRHAPAWAPIAMPSLVLWPFGAVMAWLAWQRLYEYAPPILVVAMLTLCVTFYGYGAPLASDMQSDAAIAHTIAVADPGRQAPLVAFRTDGASLRFYADRPVLVLTSVRRLRLVIARQPRVFVVTHRHHLRRLRGIELHRWREARHLLLAAQRPSVSD